MTLQTINFTKNKKTTQRVSISVLGYNNLDDTIECLDSVFKLEGNQYPVVFVDNGSEDKSSESVEKFFHAVKIIRLPSNLGFAAGTNRGLEWVCKQGYEFCLILNNDVLLDKAMINEMLLVADQHEDCAVVMPRIFYLPLKVKNRKTRRNIWSDGGYYRNFPPSIKLKDNRRSKNFDNPRSIEFAPGCALLIKCAALEKIGIFDEKFFLFYEDWDFSIRVRKAGFSIWCAPKAVLYHKVSQSTMRNPNLYWEHMGSSMSLFFSKHFNKQQAFANIQFRILRDFILCIKNLRYLKPFLRGLRKLQ